MTTTALRRHPTDHSQSLASDEFYRLMTIDLPFVSHRSILLRSTPFLANSRYPSVDVE
ncbi:hypothetical protein M6B38_341590 [Iris pallida]|uniref:Uncharacterized protein n=1 Tax=Iris pallida TaxID=29817 RepID=A0AAX6GY21_IRIPA|nr:hypothetical protein M6B38_341590 [Iris pallida]